MTLVDSESGEVYQAGDEGVNSMDSLKVTPHLSSAILSKIPPAPLATGRWTARPGQLGSRAGFIKGGQGDFDWEERNKLQPFQYFGWDGLLFEICGSNVSDYIKKEGRSITADRFRPNSPIAFGIRGPRTVPQ